MPTYSTPNPIDLAITLQVGEIEIVASDREDTVVTVTPTNPAKTVDQRGASETKVEFDGTRLTVTGPRPRLSWIGFGPNDSVDVRVELPTGSRLTADIAVGALLSSGRLGATRIKNSLGSVDLDVTGDLWLRASHGNVNLGTAEGESEITADHGQIRVGTVSDAIFKASHGSIQIGESHGDVDASLSYGDLEITRVLGSVTAKTAYGTLQLHEVASGAIELESGFGQVTVGVQSGVPAWLDLASTNGHVRNELDSAGSPDEAEHSIAIRARTQFGNITVRHAR